MPSSKGSSVSDCGLNYVPPENTDVLSVVPVNVTLVGNTVFFWWGGGEFSLGRRDQVMMS